MQINELLTNAKLGVLTKGSKFFSSLVFSLVHTISEDIPNACTNGTWVKYNPKFFESLTKDERIFLILHETLHVAFLHLVRIGNRDPKIWNHAGDYVINLILVNAGFTIPKGGLFNPAYHGLSTEEVYEKLLSNNKNNKSNANAWDDLDISKEMSDIDKAAMENKVKQILVNAKTRSEIGKDKAGSIPAELDRLIEELTNPKLAWFEILERFLTDKRKEDYSWSRPNRRYFPEHILPSLYSESLGHIVIAIDTSGSVTDEELTEMLGEIKYVYETLKPSKLTIMDCDYVIHNIHEIEDGEDILTLRFSGGGGTRFEPVFDHLVDDPPEVLIYFTDLGAKQITEEPDYSVIWICTSSHSPAPIGETIYLN